MKSSKEQKPRVYEMNKDSKGYTVLKDAGMLTNQNTEYVRNSVEISEATYWVGLI